MNTGILLAGEGEREAVETGFRLAQKFVEDSEKRFTRFSNQSELAQLNRSAGSWFDASKDMFEVVSLALQLYRQTGGLFDPSILEALEQAGYDRSMDEIRLHGPTAVTVLPRPKLHYFNEVRLDESALPHRPAGGNAHRPGWDCQELDRRESGCAAGELDQRLRRGCRRGYLLRRPAPGRESLAR